MQPQYVGLAWMAWAMDHGLAVVAGVLLIGGMLVASDLRADDA